MGYSMRTKRYRYTEWIKFPKHPPYSSNWGDLNATELYDYDTDPEGNINQAGNPDYKMASHNLSQALHAGWRLALDDLAVGNT